MRPYSNVLWEYPQYDTIINTFMGEQSVWGGGGGGEF